MAEDHGIPAPSIATMFAYMVEQRDAALRRVASLELQLGAAYRRADELERLLTDAHQRIESLVTALKEPDHAHE